MDLVIIIALSIVMVPVIVLTTGIIRAILGIVFVLFIPGYALISALFPKRQSLGNIERSVLSIGASLAITTFIGVILNFTPLGIRLLPAVVLIICFILVTSGIAWLRRIRLPAGERFSLSFAAESMKSIAVYENKNSRLRNIIYIAAVVLVLGSLAAMYTISSLSNGPKANEFYLLSTQGTTENYTRTIHMGESVSMDAVIINYKPKPLDYVIRVEINGQEIASSDQILVNPNQKWQKQLSFVPQTAGNNQKVEYLLYNSDNTSTPIDQLYIWIDVIK
jgi:uncharacterized membrane protein